MLVQNHTLLPMFKPWSPMSVGSWLVFLFPAFTVVSFVDALIARRVFRIGGWRYDRTLHGTPLGLIWSLVGGVLALAVAAYSGVLLSVTNFGGWSNSPMIGALYVATAAVTGIAAVLLIEAIRRDTDVADVAALLRVETGLIVWQLVLLLLFFFTLGKAGFEVFLHGGPLLAILGALLLGIVLPLVLRATRFSLRPSNTAVFAALILVGGFLLRYAVVMGPQQGRFIPGAG
jgi:formate-dependent nitrite reductase membrane component NrfD